MERNHEAKQKSDALDKDKLTGRAQIRCKGGSDLLGLSAGIAHEINNPLAVMAQEVELMSLYLDQMKEGLPDAEQSLRESLEQLGREINRCREVTHRMLALARNQEIVFQVTDINALVEDMVLLVEKEASKSGVKIRRRYSPDLVKVPTDPPLLKQVVLNVLNNALQAVRKGQEVRVSTEPGESDWVEISVNDNGPGITPEDMARIFTPFFTTKSSGKGTGLGLTICRTLMEKLGGHIEVESTLGSGSEFRIILPLRAPMEVDHGI